MTGDVLLLVTFCEVMFCEVTFSRGVLYVLYCSVLAVTLGELASGEVLIDCVSLLRGAAAQKDCMAYHI
jgi:hypothetical protein